MRNFVFQISKIVAAALAIFAALAVGLAIAGGYLSYSPVPYSDEWGVFEFFEKISSDHWSAWWAQHNEHRIVLARILFWIDLKWFGDAEWPLVIANFLLISASALLFWRIIFNIDALKKFNTIRWALGFFVTAWLFLWIQQENFTWGFQSQFILAQLLPLSALYWLYKSTTDARATNFIVACGLGVASVGTMANGVLALPLMAFYAALTRQKMARVNILVACSVVMLVLYFAGYHTPVQTRSISQELRQNPIGLIQFALVYLGSPFYYLLGYPFQGTSAALSFGLILVASSTWLALRLMRQPRNAKLELALLIFVLYIGCTALGTAGGRLVFGLNQALVSRYTTPALMAWAALLTLYVATLSGSGEVGRKILFIPLIPLVLSMASSQLQALQPNHEELFERKIAALALELQIKDPDQIRYIYPDTEWVLSIADQPSTQNLSIFIRYPFLDARKELSMHAKQMALPVCRGALDAVKSIAGDNKFIHVTGWIYDPGINAPPTAVRFLNDQGNIIGYALTGQPRFDVASLIGKNALFSGYKGYLLVDQKKQMITLQAEDKIGPLCQLYLNNLTM